MTALTLLGFALASAALLAIPGPTVLLVLSYAVAQGRRVAVATAFGVALGDLIAMTISLAGLGTLMAVSATLYTTFKWVGAAYLVWLGVSLFRSASRVVEQSEMTQADIPSRSIVRHAALVTALNPKSIAFFVAFVPQFIDPASAALPQFIVLTAIFVSLAALNALLYALLGARIGTTMRSVNARRWLARIGGATLVSMGLATALHARPVTPV